ncbi:MAG TPA: hypothetical protein VN969_36880 [Streptosporangiaceae bacterium]|nr:hypothetical protein [Streptosporangiaceae bacterium]
MLAYLAGLPPIRLHDLRHLAATLALAANVDIKIVREMDRMNAPPIRIWPGECPTHPGTPSPTDLH